MTSCSTSGTLGVSTFPGNEINVGDKEGCLNAQNCKCSERSYTNVYVHACVLLGIPRCILGGMHTFLKTFFVDFERK